MLFGKKKGEIFSTQTGKAISLTEVPDEVFSQKMLGDGAAVIPEGNEIVCPVGGTIVDVTPTLHAYCIHTDDDLDILVHIGIDTVELKGEGFKSLVKTGDAVKAGDPLAAVDIAFLKEKGYPIYTPIIITNMDAVKTIAVHAGEVQAGKSCVISYTLK